MKVKRLLRFYFSADGLDRALNNLMTAAACRSGAEAGRGQESAQRLCALIGAKCELGALWGYLHGVLGGMDGEERQTLADYARRRGRRPASAEQNRATHRAAVKFARRLGRLERYAEGVKVLERYYFLCPPE